MTAAITRTASRPRDAATPLRVAASAAAREGGRSSYEAFHDWYAAASARTFTRVERVPLDELTGWETEPGTGNLRHHTGGFFTVEGLDVRMPAGPVPAWSQPIINQPEVGVLGILVKEFDGVLHCLMQAKVEPGNANGVQISPTVQATRSNYTGVHGGRPVPYLDRFRSPGAHGPLVDVRQSEQGSAFHHKRNRNMVVEAHGEVEVHEGFHWLTLGQLHRLLAEDDVVNMDARTVLSCLPFAHAELARELGPPTDPFRAALFRSCDPSAGVRHPSGAVLSWITEARTRTEVHARRVPLAGLPGWHRTPERVSHASGAFFDVIGVRVEAGGREVAHWSQPMIEPHGTGVVAFLTRSFDGVLHVLMNARVEAGYMDVVELAPTVQCTPASYEHLPRSARPRYLDAVEGADPSRIRFQSVLSEEGGRFHHARNRYLIVDTDVDVPPDDPDYRWMTVHQLVELLRHSHYLNIQARSLVACLQSLLMPDAPAPATERKDRA
ncbi:MULTISPECIES: NDP-hexose 2,3-dehydratase family protein [unclassified Streptomyces]|uniref:NDP-hexose 2,3-dehydratase family protein n=1 Tax=unclassified Streptomyces TaxID=2593676 RepID=UPI0006F402D3|nr:MULTISPECIES: NDP-hexose 2,3-dehydratase family protein [unclassified Streptomyces]KQX56323.1 NDP-hexose 2,3-dehydratase [Streptomyces sp. Root1304]KRA97138.1 NDP-hexose 2,3-dehydratase [Streptomyces sp. Root66D1]